MGYNAGEGEKKRTKLLSIGLVLLISPPPNNPLEEAMPLFYCQSQPNLSVSGKYQHRFYAGVYETEDEDRVRDLKAWPGFSKFIREIAKEVPPSSEELAEELTSPSLEDLSWGEILALAKAKGISVYRKKREEVIKMLEREEIIEMLEKEV